MKAPRTRRLLLSLALLCSLPLQAERRAIIIGNGAYTHARSLPNAPNDASDVAAQLRSGGWKVTLVQDAGVKSMVRSLREFCETARGAEAALFFYAGHGVEVKGQNYLLPVDAKLAEDDGEDALPLETLALDKVLTDLGSAGIGLKFIVLDCCRDNPLQRSWIRSRSGGGGMAAVDEKKLAEGSMLVFSTAPGRTAEDGRGRNSPFTEALLKRLATGGGAADIFGDVAKTLGSRQQAWIRFDGSGTSFAAFRDYTFVPGGTPRPAMPAPAPLVDPLKAATRERPFVNSLGMEFIPVPGQPGLLTCRTETRVRDFRAYARAADYTQSGGIFVMKVTEKGTSWELDSSASWEKPGFTQTEEHPVVGVSWNEAHEFLAWLSKKEGRSYRLPSDEEWSAAVGVGKYPWGSTWPPPKDVGNYAGTEWAKDLPGTGWPTAYDHSDGFARTAPAASFTESRNGFYDLGGNVWEWCEDKYRASMNSAALLEEIPALKKEVHDDGIPYRVLRGGSWNYNVSKNLLSSYRHVGHPTFRGDYYGFRVVVVVSGG